MTNDWGGRLLLIQHLVSNNSGLFYVLALYAVLLRKNEFYIQGIYIYILLKFWCVLSLYIFRCCVSFCYISISCYDKNNDNNENNKYDNDYEDEDHKDVRLL